MPHAHLTFVDMAGKEPAGDIYSSSLDSEDNAWLYESHHAIETCLSRHLWLQQAGPKLPLEVPYKSSKVNTGLECMTVSDWADPMGIATGCHSLQHTCGSRRQAAVLSRCSCCCWMKSLALCILHDGADLLQVTHILKDVFVEEASLALCINLSPAAEDFCEETLQLLEDLSLPLKQRSSAHLRYEIMAKHPRL